MRRPGPLAYVLLVAGAPAGPEKEETTMEDRTRPILSWLSMRLVLGLCLAAVGALVLLDNLNVFEIDRLWDYWPVILILLGVARLLQPQGRGLGFLLLGVGVWLLGDNLGYWDLDTGDLFAALLILFGGYLALTALSRGRGPRRAVTDEKSVDLFAIMGGVNRTCNSQDFQGGSATVFIGACELDLRPARIAHPPAVIDAFAWWGGVEITVPEDWTVELRGVPILGGFEDNTRPPADGPTQRLVVRGMAIMGGVEVKNSKKEK
jgi:hypothetical protein